MISHPSIRELDIFLVVTETKNWSYTELTEEEKASLDHVLEGIREKIETICDDANIQINFIETFYCSLTTGEGINDLRSAIAEKVVAQNEARYEKTYSRGMK